MPIAARFHELRDRVVATVDFRFAEPVRLSFMKNGSLDPDRPQMQIDAILRTGAEKPSGIDGNAARSWRSKIAAGQAELFIDRTSYAGPAFSKHDVVRALSRPGEPVFEVVLINDRDHSRLILGLGQK